MFVFLVGFGEHFTKTVGSYVDIENRLLKLFWQLNFGPADAILLTKNWGSLKKCIFANSKLGQFKKMHESPKS